jgi:phytoene dehydrogenase-like protein
MLRFVPSSAIGMRVSARVQESRQVGQWTSPSKLGKRQAPAPVASVKSCHRVGRGHDAVVVGSGPNGLAAAIELARSGRSVLVLEAADRPGGGTRSAELTLPRFVHDVCSAVHPLAAASPFLAGLPQEALGLAWVQPNVPVAHPLDGDTAAVAERSLDATATQLGRDGRGWRRLFAPLVRHSKDLIDDILAPPHLPRHPLALARFGVRGIRSSMGLATLFENDGARALLGGMGAHSALPLSQLPTGAVGLMFGMLAHTVGWPIPRGGSGRIAEALLTHYRSLGGELVTSHRVRSISDVPPARAILFDVTPRQLARIMGDHLPSRYRRALEGFRHGPGAYKVDWALDGPIPWRAEGCARAGTVHVGGTLREVAESEAAAWRGSHAERPFLILAQPSLFDASRAPEGRHTAWAYCHVPNGSTVDMTARIEAQVERFAPGFRDRILARHVMSPVDFELHNENLLGGDISGGVMNLRQVFFRPVPRLDPYRTPLAGVYLCSSSTPPGPGVHGMCGYYAARSALRGSLR